jgi:2-keto-3-deoxy-L-rhamnonate aldolase RhmA
MTPSIVPQNRLKKILNEGQPAFGTMLVELRQPSVMQLLANTGFDFVIIDCEHGPFSIETIAELSRSARQFNVTPIVRVPEITYAALTQPLDAGAQGIMIPRVTSEEQVTQALQYMKYPPLGRRGSVLSRGHTQFKSGNVQETLQALNEESMLIVQIETTGAMQRLDAILSVEGIDVALVGPTDLSVAFGRHGDFQHSEIQSAIETVVERCQKVGIIPAIHMNDLEQALFWAQRGMQMLSYNSEIGMLTMMGMQALASLRKSFRRP